MALTDHVGILLSHSFDVARMNKKKTRAEFYAQIAFPPAALPEFAALVGAIYPGIALSTLEVNIKPNAQQTKPFVGVLADWYVIRLASQFAPELYAADGATRIPTASARQHFFAGMRVRVHSSAWGWKNEFSKSGASFNLLGVMDAGQGGEKLAIGGAQSAAAFAAHGNPNAVASVQSAPIPAPIPAAVPVSPFGTAQAATAPAGGNPFAQAAPAAANPNPFATA